MQQLQELFYALLLGAVQGITEFLPISSTVHVGLASQLFSGGKDLGIYATNLISLGTTVALIQYFWSDIRLFLRNYKNITQWLQIIVATLPIIIATLLLLNTVDSTLRGMRFFGIFLISGALLLALAEWFYAKHHQPQKTQLTLRDYAIVGLFQALAILPGMSRSGSTLSGGLFLAKKREEVIKASFWISLPAFVLAGIYSVFKLIKAHNPPHFIATETNVSNLSWISIGVGAITAYWVGLKALQWLIPYLSKHNSTGFIIYRVLLGVILILLSTQIA